MKMVLCDLNRLSDNFIFTLNGDKRTRHLPCYTGGTTFISELLIKAGETIGARLHTIPCGAAQEDR
jgi:hypothetical protein